ncbi:conserved hypothetical protein [Ricinus communis]|uniref:Uncharacterized protein n=1 Tax=Ricinus communis TaxID=3988 RepID=B9SSR5_RICCO|nr:conserved hypothetical protein [Ricinus communis]
MAVDGVEEDNEEIVTEIKAVHFEASMKYARRVSAKLIFASTRHLLEHCSSLEDLVVEMKIKAFTTKV